mmetsp:Transcript_5596/g.11179  ORF Transcript_5596/g.11179 Transcript_5596/m.11179 type:complete len:207 (+) Transcript_5596:312-932(+)
MNPEGPRFLPSHLLEAVPQLEGPGHGLKSNQEPLHCNVPSLANPAPPLRDNQGRVVLLEVVLIDHKLLLLVLLLGVVYLKHAVGADELGWIGAGGRDAVGMKNGRAVHAADIKVNRGARPGNDGRWDGSLLHRAAKPAGLTVLIPLGPERKFLRRREFRLVPETRCRQPIQSASYARTLHHPNSLLLLVLLLDVYRLKPGYVKILN